MWLVCKRGKCNQFSSINTFWNVNLRISQLKQTDSEGKSWNWFWQPSKSINVGMWVDWPGVQCFTQPQSLTSVWHWSWIPDSLSPIYQTSDQILCYKSTKILSWILWYLYPKNPLRSLSLTEENNKWNMYLFI